VILLPAQLSLELLSQKKMLFLYQELIAVLPQLGQVYLNLKIILG
jgi:hypothetical protein